MESILPFRAVIPISQMDGIIVLSIIHNGGSETNEVCIVDLETRQLQRLTYGREKGHPIWSPDGKRLTWFDHRHNRMVIFDVTSQKTLGKFKTEDPWCDYFWSRDGQRVLSSCGNVRVDVSKIEVSHSPLIIQSDFMSLSPDEQYFAYTQRVQENRVASTLFVTQNESTVFKSDFLIYYPTFMWSPDSTVLLVLDDAEDIKLFFLYIPTGEIASFEPPEWDTYFWYWSPSGNKIAYKTEDTIEVIEIQFNTNPFSYTVVKEQSFYLGSLLEQSSSDGYLAWSPDEKFIALTSYKFKERFGEAYIYEAGKIWILNLESGKQTLLIPEN